MNALDIANASSDASVTARRFLPLLVAARRDADARIVRLATGIFVRKCSEVGASEWHLLLAAIEREDEDSRYLESIATLGRLAMQEDSDEVDLKWRMAVEYILEFDPSDSCLSLPVCWAFDDRNYSTLASKWKAIVAKHMDNPLVLANAAMFFCSRDAETARFLIDEAIRLAPNDSQLRHLKSNFRQYLERKY